MSGFVYSRPRKIEKKMLVRQCARIVKSCLKFYVFENLLLKVWLSRKMARLYRVLVDKVKFNNC